MKRQRQPAPPSPAASLAAEWTREVLGYVVHGPLVYRVRRVRSDGLARAGLAELEGSDAYAAVRAELERQAEEAIYVAGRPADEQPAAREALAAKRRKDEARHLLRLERDPVAREALVKRAAAYVCAAIDGAARLADPADGVLVQLEPPEIVGDWYPWRWVPLDAEEDHEAGVVSVGYVPEPVVYAWGQVIQSLLQGVTRRSVAQFRAGAGDAAAAPPAGADVRDGPGGDRVRG